MRDSNECVIFSMVIYNGRFEAYYFYNRFVIILAKGKRVIEPRVATAFYKYLGSYDKWKNRPPPALSNVQFFHREEDGPRSSGRSRLDAPSRLTAISNEQNGNSVARKDSDQELARLITIITIKRKRGGEENRIE